MTVPNSSPAPVWIAPEGSARTMERLGRQQNQFNESFLQKLLADHSELLPVEQIRNDVGRMLCIGREVSVPSGSIDILYLSTSGYVVVVETKLWRNPQARREVLSQLLDYIKDIVRKDYEWIAERWAEHNRSVHGAEMDLPSRLDELRGEPLDEGELVDRVNGALNRGDVIAMVVGDGIESRLQQLVTHLCRDTTHLRYALALVELACYQLPGLPGASPEGMLVVPRIVQDVEPVQRAHVRIDIADGVRDHLRVSSVVEPRPVGREKRPTLSEESLLREIELAEGLKCRETMQRFMDDLVASFDLDLKFAQQSAYLRVPHPEELFEGASVLAFERQGRIFNPRTLTAQLASWKLSPDVAVRISSDYWKRLHAVDSRFALDGLRPRATDSFIPILSVADKLDAIRECVADVVAGIRAACGEAI